MSRTRIKTVAIAASRQVCVLSAVVLLAAGVCFGKLAVSVSPTSGPPTSKLLVSGSGFKPYAEIDIYFDTKDEAKAIADGSGSFSKIAIEAPASALPGKHFVSAVQRAGEIGAQAPFLVNTNWSQFGFTPDHVRDNPYENVLTPGTVGNLGLLWNYATGGAVQSSPAVAHGVVYVGSDDDAIYALKAGTGAVLWSYASQGPPGLDSPAVSDGVVYLGSLSALNASTGAVLWNDGEGYFFQESPTLANGAMYLGGVDEDYAWNASDGSLLWQVHYGYATASSMAFANGVVYFGTTNSRLYELNASDGSDIICGGPWPGSGYSSPAVANGVVYFAGGSGVSAVDTITCTLLWSYNTGDTITSSPAVASGAVYIGSDDNNLYALNANTGAVLWSYTTGGAVTSSPAVANGVVYVGSDDDKLYALNASTGALLWSYTTGGSVESSPAIANGVVYVGSDDGNVYAFGLTGGGYAYTSQNPRVLSISPSSGPLSGSIAPPSSYMPTPVNNNGAPSIASFDQVAPSTGGGGIGFVQVNDAIVHSTSVSLTYGSAQTAGDLNVVAVGWNDAVSNVSSVTDTRGNIYSLAVGPTRGTGLSQSIYYAKNIVAAAAGANTVVVKFSQAPAVPDIRILEYSGLSTTTPLDVTAGAFGNSSSASSGSATTTAANELIFGANMVATATAGPGSSFTSRIITASGDIAEDSMVSSTGSYSASAPLSISGNWVMQMATFESGIITTGAPTVLSVSPSSGTDNGGTAVTITGTNFVSGAAATFGGTDTINATFVNSTTLTATTRPATAGAVTVLVTNPNGQSGSLSSGFTYTANPTLTSVSPSSGSVSGGASVTITGTNFASGATVTFGATAATNVKFVSSTSITATTPVQAAGGVNVVVTNSNGLSGTLANGFIYNAIPSTIKFVQVAAATPQTPLSSVSVTYPSAQTAGNLNVVVVGWNDTSSSVQSVTDSHNNTYTLAVGPIRGTNLSQSIYYSKNIASGSNTVTAAFNQAAAAVDLRVLEYSGADKLNPLDATASATGSSSTASSGSAPTNTGNELVVAADMVYTANAGPGPGFTKRIITSPDADLVEDEIVSTAGTYGATAPLTSSGPWVMQMATFTPVQLPATGPLQVSGSNPRYFADGSGNTTYLTGAHTWPNNRDGSEIVGPCPPPLFDWTGYLNYMQSHRYNWIRLWTTDLPTSAGSTGTICHLPFYFLRAGPGYATDGQPKWDLTQFNQAYFDRLRQRVIDAGQIGAYVSIMLFDGFGLEFNRFANDGYWFTGANNINGIDDGYTTGCCGYTSQTGSNPAITQMQDAYVTKVIDTVNDLPNVLYEIANEAGSYSTSWQEGMIDLIHTYEATKPYHHPVGFTCQYVGGSDPTYFSSKADYVEPCYSGYGWPVSETSTGNKVVIDDTDHSWPWASMQSVTASDPAAMRQWVWENFTRGANTAFMDPYTVVWPVRNCPALSEPKDICGAVNGYATNVDPYWNTIRTALSQTATYARQINLAHMTPQSALCSTTFCLANVGQQYLVYAPAGGTFTVTLAAGTYNYQWFAANAVVATGGPQSYPAGNSAFSAPSTPGLTLSAAANASGGTTVYTGTITGGGSNAYIGFQFVVAGFDKSANNGTFTCTASSTTTLTLNNAAGVSDSHGATATGTGDAVLLLTIN